MAISVELGEPLERFVESMVKDGRYNSKSEILREGVRIIQEREMRLAALDVMLAKGLADADAGREEDMDVVFDRLEARLKSEL